MPSNWVHLDVDKILKETDRAFLLLVDGEQVWVPKSVVSDPDDYSEGDTDATVSVVDWFARREGLI